MADQKDIVIAINGGVVNNPNGNINYIIVQDVARHIWYTWDGSTWSNAGGGGNNAPVGEAPRVTPGAGYLYVAFNVVNQGDAGNIVLTISDSSSMLNSSTVPVPAGGNGGVEWTGLMPATAYNITLTATPGNSQTITIQPFTGGPPPPPPPPPISNLNILLIAAGVSGAILLGAGAYYASKKPKEAKK